MITESQAVEIFKVFLRRYDDKASLQRLGGVVPLIDKTIEKPYGWVFFHNTRKYVETRENLFAMVGNSPVLIMKEDGQMHILPTSDPLELSLKQFEDKKNGVLADIWAKIRNF